MKIGGERRTNTGNEDDTTGTDAEKDTPRRKNQIESFEIANINGIAPPRQSNSGAAKTSCEAAFQEVTEATMLNDGENQDPSIRQHHSQLKRTNQI